MVGSQDDEFIEKINQNIDAAKRKTKSIASLVFHLMYISLAIVTFR